MACVGTVFDKEGLPEELIEVSGRGDSSLSVYVQDQTTRPLDLKFNRVVSVFQLSAPTVVNARTIEVVAGHSLSVGETIEMINNKNSDISVITDVNVNTITLDTLIGDIYLTGIDYDAASTDLRVDGSVTPVVFSLEPVPGQVGDITRVMIAFQSTSAMDFSGFGADPALDVGCVLRLNSGDGTYVNLFNFKTNGAFTVRSFDAIFQDKVGGGEHSLIMMSTFGGQDNRGVVIRLDGGLGERLEVVVQDDLSGSVNSLIEALAQGHGVQ